jgi:hypothetical protein
MKVLKVIGVLAALAVLYGTVTDVLDVLDVLDIPGINISHLLASIYILIPQPPRRPQAEPKARAVCREKASARGLGWIKTAGGVLGFSLLRAINQIDTFLRRVAAHSQDGTLRSISAQCVILCATAYLYIRWCYCIYTVLWQVYPYSTRTCATVKYIYCGKRSIYHYSTCMSMYVLKASHCRVSFMRLSARNSLLCLQDGKYLDYVRDFIRQPENLECPFPSTSQLSVIKKEGSIFFSSFFWPL